MGERRKVLVTNDILASPEVRAMAAVRAAELGISVDDYLNRLHHAIAQETVDRMEDERDTVREARDIIEGEEA